MSWLELMVVIITSPIWLFLVIAASAGAAAGLWFGAFLLIGAFQMFVKGWE